MSVETLSNVNDVSTESRTTEPFMPSSHAIRKSPAYNEHMRFCIKSNLILVKNNHLHQYQQ